MSSFDSTKIALPDIIKDIGNGKVQLPDFQRGWVWTTPMSVRCWSAWPALSRLAR